MQAAYLLIRMRRIYNGSKSMPPKISRELTAVLRLIQEENAKYQALVLVLHESGLLPDLNALGKRAELVKADPRRMEAISENFLRLLSEMS
jgi:hypothetical protein